MEQSTNEGIHIPDCWNLTENDEVYKDNIYFSQ